jgi:5-methylcytosine-specific restriction enzyme B
MSFAIFPAEEGKPCLVTMVVGTNGLSPDEAILGRPGHARKLQAIARWLNHQRGESAAWSKFDPTRIDVSIHKTISTEWFDYAPAIKLYGKELYFMYRPNQDRELTGKALKALLDLMFKERGYPTLKGADSNEVEREWFAHLMPETKPEDVIKLLNSRRYVVLQGPPGTGKTTMAATILKERYKGHGVTIQFHPSTTYENFVGGLAPATDANTLGFRFARSRAF